MGQRRPLLGLLPSEDISDHYRNRMDGLNENNMRTGCKTQNQCLSYHSTHDQQARVRIKHRNQSPVWKRDKKRQDAEMFRIHFSTQIVFDKKYFYIMARHLGARSTVPPLEGAVAVLPDVSRY